MAVYECELADMLGCLLKNRSHSQNITGTLASWLKIFNDSFLWDAGIFLR